MTVPPMIFPAYIAAARQIDGKELEKQLRAKGLADAQIRAVRDVLKENGLIADDAVQQKTKTLFFLGLAVALLLAMAGAVIAMQMAG